MGPHLTGVHAERQLAAGSPTGEGRGTLPPPWGPGACWDRRREVGAGMSTDVERLIASSPLLGSLMGEDLPRVLAAGHVLQRAAGRGLLAEGEDAAVVLIQGTASSRALSMTGEEYLRRFHGPGETVGLTVALGLRDDLAILLAASPVAVLKLAGSDLRRLVSDHPGVARACLRATAVQLAQAHRDEAALTGASAPERVAVRLVELAERWGRPERDGVVVSLKITQEELASWARVSRESTAKTLHHLREADVLVTGRRQLVITDLPALRRRAAHPPHEPTIRSLLSEIG